MEGSSARLVVLETGLPQGTAGANGGAGRTIPLRRRTDGKRGGKGPVDCAAGNGATEMEGGGFGTASERKSKKSKDRATVATGDDYDNEVDSGSVKNGHVDPRDQPALSFKELEIVSLLRTDTCQTRVQIQPPNARWLAPKLSL